MEELAKMFFMLVIAICVTRLLKHYHPKMSNMDVFFGGFIIYEGIIIPIEWIGKVFP